MPLESEWVNDHVVIYRVLGSFKLDDLRIINDDMLAKFKEASTTYHVLLDGTQTTMLNFSPNDSLRQSPYLKQDQMKSLIVFGAPTYLQAIASLIGMIVQTSTGTQVHFVATEADALAIVEQIERVE